MSDNDQRPVWDWTNDMRQQSTIRVEPAFKNELGTVFVGIGEWAGDGQGWSGPHQGIWLDPQRVRDLCRALSAADDWALLHADDA